MDEALEFVLGFSKLPPLYFLSFPDLWSSLAYVEVYLALARIMSSFDFELYDTNREDDIDQYHDFVSPFPKAGSEGLRVIVKPIKSSLVLSSAD